MRKHRKAVIVGAIVAVVLAIGAGVAIAGAGDDDRPLTGSTLERAKAAALEHVGGGTVLEAEVGDDGAAYSVGIRRPDGSIVEVSLDERFQVVGTIADDEGSETDAESD